MNDLTSYFGSKKERDDFFIAIAVIIFFMLFFGFNIFSKSEEPVFEEEMEVVEAPILVIQDSDLDGIADEDDKCPLLFGTNANKGCPNDLDGDGVYDSEDLCPKVKGPAALNGCPRDTDKDGVINNKDVCPKIPGVKENRGCPADRDKDGVYDKDDRCPDSAGTISNNGCPEIIIEENDAAILRAAMKSVEFETGKATLTANSSNVLNQIHIMMEKYPRYKLKVIGHTDNVGDPANNLALSKDRARSCLNYFISRGVNPNRLSSNGFGSRNPIDSNETAAGRQNNRRVEFKFYN